MIHASSSQPANDFVRVGAIAGFEGPKQQLGVLMSDGVTELGVSGIADPLEGSLAARTLFGSADRTIIRSANGFQFVPRYNFETLPAVDRVLVAHPGENPSAKQQVVSAWTTHQPRRPVEDIYQSAGDGQMAYDVSFADITRTRNGSLARAPATVLLHAGASQVAGNWPIGEVFVRGADREPGWGGFYLRGWPSLGAPARSCQPDSPACLKQREKPWDINHPGPYPGRPGASWMKQPRSA